MSHHQKRPEYDEVIENSPCSQMYKVLEGCLSAHNRDWVSCQAEVKQWRECFANSQKKEKE
jgi:hypothetical protein